MNDEFTENTGLIRCDSDGRWLCNEYTRSSMSLNQRANSVDFLSRERERVKKTGTDQEVESSFLQCQFRDDERCPKGGYRQLVRTR